MYVHVWCPWRPENNVTGGYELPRGFWEFNSGSVHKQPVMLATEPSLQFSYVSFFEALLIATRSHLHQWVSVLHASFCAFLWVLSFEVRFLSPLHLVLNPLLGFLPGSLVIPTVVLNMLWIQ